MPTLADIIGAQVQAAIEGAFAKIEPSLDRIAVDGGTAAGDALTGGSGSIVSLIEGLLLGGALAGTGIGELIAFLKTAEGNAGKIGEGFAFGWVLGSAVFQIAGPVLQIGEQFVASLVQSGNLDSGTLARLQAQGVITGQYAGGEAAQNNTSDHDYHALSEAAISWPDVITALTLRNRDLISDELLDKALQRHGYDREIAGALKGLARVLLSPADIALADLRGNISKATAHEYVKQLGMSDDDYAVMVGNTGEPPGIEQMLEMERRGIITPERLKRGILQSRVRDEWIPYIEASRYRPMDTSDAIRAYVQNYITFKEAEKIAAENGINPKDFATLVPAYGDPLAKGEVLELLNRGEISVADAKQNLRESRLKDRWINDALKLRRRMIPERTLNTIVAHGIRPPEWAISHLIELGFSKDDASALVSTVTEGRSAIHKNLTANLIEEMYSASAIDEQEALRLLAELGWDQTQGEFMLAALDARKALQEQGKAVTAVRKAFLAHRIDETKARFDLAAVHVLKAQADQLLKDWRVELADQVAELTASDIGDAVKYSGGLVSWDMAVRKLVQLGYTENDAGIFLLAHEGVPPKGWRPREVAP